MKQKQTHRPKIKKIILFILTFSLVAPLDLLTPAIALAANTKIRQEINITDAYYYAASGSYATSSEIVAITDNNYSSPYYYFEVVASTTAATNATVKLVNATSSATVATLTINNGNTYTRYRSAAFLPNASTTVEYKIVLGNESVGKGIIASRIVVLQNAATLANTETQIEIGNNETYTGTATSTFTSPKYWYYDSSKWDGSPTFYAEVTYAPTVPIAASSTDVYSAAGSYTLVASTTLADVAIWGGGGAGFGGTISNNAGGGAGGGGGAFASSTLTFTIGSTIPIVVGAGGGASAANGGTTTVNVTQIIAAPGWGGKAQVGTGGLGGATASSTGTVTRAGGKGGNGVDGGNSKDYGGGGGGAGGPHGNGNVGANGSGSTTAGGQGDVTSGGTGGTGSNNGSNNTNGGGGGGGGPDNANGGNGGAYGGGGGGAGATGGFGSGAAGAVTLTFRHFATTTISLEVADGSEDGFVNWTPIAQIVTQNDFIYATTTRVRSAAFTPTNGRNYRIAFKEGYTGATHAIYNAKIIVVQTGTPTKIQPQYLLANTKFANNTSLQKFLNYWNPSEWSTTNAYIFQAETADNSASVMGLNAAEGSKIANSFLSSPDNRATSTALCMPYMGDLDTQATTNGNDIYATRILVDVGGTPSSCGVSSGTRKILMRMARLRNIRLR